MSNEVPLIKVKNYNEAVEILEKAKLFRTSLMKGEEFNINPTFRTDPSARSLFMCENTWLSANIGEAGLFSSWMLDWYQNGNSGPTHVTAEPVGFPVGWSWDQKRTHSLSTTSFCVQGIVTFGIDMSGMVVGSRDVYHIKVKLQRDCTLSASEGYGFCNY